MARKKKNKHQNIRTMRRLTSSCQFLEFCIRFEVAWWFSWILLLFSASVLLNGHHLPYGSRKSLCYNHKKWQVIEMLRLENRFRKKNIHHILNCHEISLSLSHSLILKRKTAVILYHTNNSQEYRSNWAQNQSVEWSAGISSWIEMPIRIDSVRLDHCNIDMSVVCGVAT